MNRQDMMEMQKRMSEMRKERSKRLEVDGEELEFLLEKIYLAIESELRDSAYYRALADIAPNQFAAEIITEFANDEREHAYQLEQAYQRITGNNFSSQYEYEFELEAGDYESELEKSIVEETGDYKKYKSYYLMTKNPYLRDVFFNAMHDEAQHAQRELYLLHVYGMPMT
ncbi:MAG: ferritin family protein [Bacillota bacterium]